MGGEISVRSEVGQGTTFRFDIQVGQVEAGAVPTTEPARRVIGLEPGQPVCRLLVVEDEVDNRKLLVKLLEPLGFDIREASNGREGIEVWEQWQPDLIWMDMRMPVMDGYEATRQIKTTPEGQSTIIVALTASAFEEDRAAVIAVGCDDFVRKPFREAEIFDVLARHLGVRYVYEEPLADLAQAKVEHKPLIAADLAALPSALLADLRQAAKEINLEKANAIIARISQTNEPLAQALADLVENFRFDTLQALVEEIKQ
jgi:CheY-like chemotaxis protein